MQTATVKYQIGSYKGTLKVVVDENDSNDIVIAKAKAQLDREAGTELPIGDVNFVVINRIDNVNK